MPIKTSFQDAKYKRAIKKVDKTAHILQKYGLGYCRTAGLIGDTSSFSKKDNKKISAAADTMRKFSAGYYPTKNNFDDKTPINPNRYVPLSMVDNVEVQKKSYEQALTSMHLRAPLKFIQRTNYDPRLQSHPNRRVLGISPEEAQEWSALTESLWRDDKESKSWDESLQNNYAQLSDMALYKYLGIGEFFAIRRSYSDDPERISNLSLQMINPSQVQQPIGSQYLNLSYYDHSISSLVSVNSAQYLSELETGSYIESGIEYNSKNQEIAIYLAPSKPGDDWMRIPVKNGNGFTQVLHGFIQTEEGQKRGIPEAAYSHHEYAMAADLELFEMESARLNTVIAGAVTADSNAAPGGAMPMNDLGDAGWPSDTTTNEITGESEPSFSTRKVDGGGFILQKFDPGYKYTELSTTRPNMNIPEYLDQIFKFQYPSNFGISSSVVTQKFSGSYNASKGEIDLSWKNGIEYHIKQFTSDWDKLNYEAWLNGKIATGRISAPGWEDPEKRNAWASMTIITPAKPSLNPLQEAKAGKERISYAASNIEFEAQTQTGTSAEENMERLEQENTKLAKANKPLIPEPVPVPANNKEPAKNA
ncbi:phage portal protein [Candidatus Pacearchaeota archaeon]|nr:phage portal protein [Candidatus Pacearchaeota archaeon]